MRTIRKSFMTLLETMIAFTLLSVLLVFIFGAFNEMTKINQMTEQAEAESFQLRYTGMRLSYIFERIVNEKHSARKFFFYAEPAGSAISNFPSLICTFDNEVRKNPAFSGDVLARIYLDTNQSLCLAIWPLHVENPKEWLHREVLMENVSELNFSFYAAPKLKKTIETGTEKKNPLRGQWQTEWLFEYGEMPSLVKINLKNNSKEDKTFHFVLPSSKNPVAIRSESEGP